MDTPLFHGATGTDVQYEPMRQDDAEEARLCADALDAQSRFFAAAKAARENPGDDSLYSARGEASCKYSRACDRLTNYRRERYEQEKKARALEVAVA